MRGNIWSSAAPMVVLSLVVSITLTEGKSSTPWNIRSSTSRCGTFFSRVRGGATKILEDGRDNEGDERDEDETESEDDDEEEGDNEETDAEVIKKRQALQKYRMDQQFLMQLRGVVLSEELTRRGLPLPNVKDVFTPAGEKPPEIVDWDCAMSTEEQPKSCLITLDVEVNTKVVAPLGTAQWISLTGLNQLRRTDPSKVETMWHSKYAIQKTWFGEDSRFSMLQHTGTKGFILNTLLDKAPVLQAVVIMSLLSCFVVLLPAVEFVINRFLCSPLCWSTWSSWARFVHAAFPLKLMLLQAAYKFVLYALGKVVQSIRDYLVELECNHLEETIPLTVGPGSEVEKAFEIGSTEDQEQEDVFDDAVDEDFDYEEMDDDDDDDDDDDW